MPQWSTEKQLLGAAISAITLSCLADWNAEGLKFDGQTDDSKFEAYHETLGPYGRWVCWTLFSVGAENLVKASCMTVGFEPKTMSLGFQSLPEKDADSEALVAELKTIQHAGGRRTKGYEILHYQTLGDLRKNWLPELAKALNLNPNEEAYLIGGVRLLTDVIRNRDAHAYQPMQRVANFYLVNQVFIPCFEILLRGLSDESKKDVPVPPRGVAWGNPPTS